MTYNPYPKNTQVWRDPGGRQRVSEMTTLFDGKTLTADETLVWDTKGTGTATFSVNKMNLAVTAGQYLVRQGKFFCPYFSGKSQLAEMTFDTFAFETGITKRAGYFSSSATAPYTANLDGWYLESSGANSTYYLVAVNDGTETLRVAWTDWTGYAEIAGYDWDNFTVGMGDMLWLGGATLRFFLKDPDGDFVLAHEFNYAGSAPDTFMKSPQHPVRYEIRSTTGAGSMRAICSQVSSEGSISERGKSGVVYMSSAIAANTTGTIYAVKGIRKVSTYRDTAVTATSFGGSIISPTSDAGIFLLILNPTLSAPLTWAANGRIEEGTAAAGQTVTAGTGRVIGAKENVDTAESSPVDASQLSDLPVDIDNTMGEIVLCYMPYTNTQNITGHIEFMEY